MNSTADLDYATKCGMPSSCLDDKLPRDYVTRNILNMKRPALLENMRELINTMTDKTGDVHTNDITTRKKTYWLVEQLTRTLFGLREGEPYDATFMKPDQGDQNSMGTIREVKA